MPTKRKFQEISDLLRTIRRLWHAKPQKEMAKIIFGEDFPFKTDPTKEYGEIERGAERLSRKQFDNLELAYFKDESKQNLAPDNVARIPALLAELKLAVEHTYKSSSPDHLLKGDQVGLKGLEKEQSEHQLQTKGVLKPTKSARQPVLIGRQVEMRYLRDIWATVQQGGTRFVVIQGESGIGKTALAEWWREEIRQQGANIAQVYCYLSDQNNKYRPIKLWLEQEALMTAQASLDLMERASVERVRSTLPDEEPSDTTKQVHMEQLFVEHLTSVFLKAKQPLALFIEDVHRCDAKSLDFLRRLLLRIREVRSQLLIVGTMRAKQMNYDLDLLLTDLTESSQLEEFYLKQLDEVQTKALAEQICGYTLAPHKVEQIFKASGGSPFYIPLAVHYDGDESLLPKDIRLILRDLRNVSKDAQELAKMAATYERPFTLELLAGATGQSDDSIVTALEELWQQDIVKFYDEPIDDRNYLGKTLTLKPGVTQKKVYVFRHDILRKAIYENMSWFEQRKFHLQVAKALEVLYAKNLYEKIVQIVAHYEAANKPVEASAKIVKAYLDKGKLDHKTFDYENAVKSYEVGLALLPQCSDIAEHEKRELEVLLYHALGLAELSRTGSTGEKALTIYGQILDLCQAYKEVPLPRGVIWGGSILMVRGELEAAMDWGKKGWQIVKDRPESWDYLDTVCLLGITEYHRGNFTAAYEYLDTGSKLYDSIQHTFVPSLQQNTGILCKSYKGLSQWFLGYPDQGKQEVHTAVNLAISQDEPGSGCIAHISVAWFYHLRHEWVKSKEYAIQAIQLAAEKYHIALFQAAGTLFDLFAQFEMSEQDKSEEVLTQLEQSWKVYNEIGATAGQTSFYSTMADMYIRVNRVDYAQLLLEQTLNIFHEGREACMLAEVYRLQGEIEKIKAEADKINRVVRYTNAEDFFNKALNIAHSQNALSLELRATMSLCRLWRQQSKYEAAYKKLSTVYAKFTEGFDTGDLQDAQAMLGDISSSIVDSLRTRPDAPAFAAA